MMRGSSVSTPLPPSRRRLAGWIVLTTAMWLSGCGANYKLSDGDYRPLGDPTAAERRQ